MENMKSNLQLSLERNPIVGWEEIFKDFEEEFNILGYSLDSLSKSDTTYPRMDDIFNAFRMTPFDSVKVVILGQDPYPQFLDSTGKPKATGSSFSIARDDPTIPKSLINILKEVKDEFPETFPSYKVSGDLSEWQKQGVLLLNGGSLTFDPNHPNTTDRFNHVNAKIWKPFIIKVMKKIAAKKSKVVFITWGNDAKRVVQDAKISNTSCDILFSPHPAARSPKGTGFSGNNHFIETNRILIGSDQTPINWCALYPK